jgi:hypothetical protein
LIGHFREIAASTFKKMAAVARTTAWRAITASIHLDEAVCM